MKKANAQSWLFIPLLKERRQQRWFYVHLGKLLGTSILQPLPKRIFFHKRKVKKRVFLKKLRLRRSYIFRRKPPEIALATRWEWTRCIKIFLFAQYNISLKSSSLNNILIYQNKPQYILRICFIYQVTALASY